MPVRWKIALVVASTLIACSHGAPETTSQQNEKLVGATLDTRDVAVVGLEQDGAGKSFCTATVIAPRVLLTAAHCFRDGVDHTYRALLATSWKTARAQDWVSVREVIVEPSYREREEEGNDIALVLLDKDVPVQPIPVNSVALDSSWNGSSARVIGYGLTGFSDEPTTTSGERREMTTLLQEVRPTVLTIGDANHQVKGGDSGGPALMRVNGVERIVGLTSYTSSTCLPGDCFTRVDRWGAFLAPYLGGKPAGAPPGKPQCQYACSDYGYGPGECDQGWYCDGACVTQTGCQP